jgi:hypothetical protein
LRLGKLLVVEVHVALRRRDIRVPQQPAGVFDPFLSADFRPAFVAGFSCQSVVRQFRSNQLALIGSSRMLGIVCKGTGITGILEESR